MTRENKRGLVKPGGRGYELTEDGERVVESLRAVADLS